MREFSEFGNESNELPQEPADDGRDGDLGQSLAGAKPVDDDRSVLREPSASGRDLPGPGPDPLARYVDEQDAARPLRDFGPASGVQREGTAENLQDVDDREDSAADQPGSPEAGDRDARGEQPGGAPDAVQTELARINERIDDMEARLLQHESSLPRTPESADEITRTEDLNEQVAQVREDITELAGTGSPQAAAVAIAGVQAATGDAEDAMAEFPQSRSVWSRIVDLFKALSRRLWNLISRLLTPIQWSVTGSVGNKVLGFAEASLTITFGQDSGKEKPRGPRGHSGLSY